MQKAIYKIRDRKLPKQIRDRIREENSGNSFIPPGWRGLVRLLDEEIAEIMPDYELAQVKSKFGSLRYYINFDDIDDRYNSIYDIIDKYERISEHVCEVCGQRGKVRGNRQWVTTRCNEHKE